MADRYDIGFEIEDWQEDVYDDPDGGPRMVRITITKRYSGALEGTGVAVTLAAQGADGQGYVASERVVGTLDGRSGSFVVQHGGLAADGSMRTFGEILAGCGTGELAGLRGRAVEEQEQTLTLEVESR